MDWLAKSHPGKQAGRERGSRKRGRRGQKAAIIIRCPARDFGHQQDGMDGWMDGWMVVLHLRGGGDTWKLVCVHNPGSHHLVGSLSLTLS